MRVGQRLREHFQRRVPVVGGARPIVQAVGDGVEFVLAEQAQIGALGKVLAQQPVGVLAGATDGRSRR